MATKNYNVKSDDTSGPQIHLTKFLAISHFSANIQINLCTKESMEFLITNIKYLSISYYT